MRLPSLSSSSLQKDAAHQRERAPLTCPGLRSARRRSVREWVSERVRKCVRGGSHLLDGFQSGHCSERGGRHLSHVHVHVAAVLADGQRGVFLRNVLSLLDIFGGLFHLRFGVHDRVCHRIQWEDARAGEKKITNKRMLTLAYGFLLDAETLEGDTSQKNQQAHFKIKYFFLRVSEGLKERDKLFCGSAARNRVTSPTGGVVCWRCHMRRRALWRRWSSSQRRRPQEKNTTAR